MKAYFLQRCIAYFIDIFIVVLVSMVFSFFIPVTEKYKDSLEKQEIILNQYENEEINYDEYVKLYNDNSYSMSKESMIFDFVSIIITLAYFGAYSYYKDGMTIGKKCMKIRIVDNNGKHPSYRKFVIRAALLHGPVMSILLALSLIFLSKDIYFLVSSGINFVYTIFSFFCIFLVAVRKDGRGLHDLISGTKVIALK